MKKRQFLFLIAFILLTFAPVPVYPLLKERIGHKNTENKAAAAFPELTPGNYTTFPRRFEEWLSDNLPFKTQFIELFRGFQFLAGTDYEQSDVIRGKEENLFYRVTVDNYKGLEQFSEQELETIQNHLSGFFGRMEESGTQCLLYIAPDKQQILSRYMPDRFRRVSEVSRGDRTAEWLSERISQTVLYPKQKLTEISMTHPVYFKTDTHWNELGGAAAAAQIRAAFSGTDAPEDIPAYHFYEEKGKDLAMMLGLSDRIREENAVLIDFNDNVESHKAETREYGRIQRFTSNAPVHKKLMIIGDSFSEYFLRSAIHDVDEVLFVTYGQLSLIDFEAEKPDYLVVMLVERNLPFLLNGFY